MPRNVTTLPKLGKTWYGDQVPDAANLKGVNLEGSQFESVDIDPTSTGDVRRRRSNRTRILMLVRNTSGGALLPGAAVKWEAGYRGRRVNAVASDQGETAGFVDEWLPATGVQDDDLFWIVVRGPVLAKKAAGSALNADTAVIAAGSGNVAAVGTPADATAAQVDGLYSCARVIETAASAATRVLVEARCY